MHCVVGVAVMLLVIRRVARALIYILKSFNRDAAEAASAHACKADATSSPRCAAFDLDRTCASKKDGEYTKLRHSAAASRSASS